MAITAGEVHVAGHRGAVADLRDDVGVIGGGEYRLAPLTVTTYDSAHIHMEHIGNRFGIVVFDECHHLPSEAYALAAQQFVELSQSGTMRRVLFGVSESPDEQEIGRRVDSAVHIFLKAYKAPVPASVG